MQFVPPLVAALVPMVMGFIWYNPNVFGKAWMKASGMTDEKVKSGNMLVIFGLMLLFAIMMSMFLTGNVIHQAALEGLFRSQPDFQDPNSEMSLLFKTFEENYGHLHRSFGHGAAHGGFVAIFFVLPIIGINALFERRGFKYIAIHVGYWFVSLILMGGIICSWVV